MPSLSDRIKPHVAAIQRDAAAGDKNAEQIITTYQMWLACPSDRGAPALCECFFEDWLKHQSVSA